MIRLISVICVPFFKNLNSFSGLFEISSDISLFFIYLSQL
jgi:hypothetical protein